MSVFFLTRDVCAEQLFFDEVPDMADIKTKMNDKLIRRLILSYSFTFILLNLADASAVLVDEFVVARFLGTDAMAAVGLSSPTFAILTLFSSVFAVGTQSLCTSALSCANEKEHQKVFNSSLLVCGSIIVLVTIGCFVLVRPLCIIYGADPQETEVFSMLEGYLRGNFIGIPGYMLFLFLSPLVVLDNNKRAITIATFAQNIINVVGDFLSVTVFSYGIEGVGFVTGISWDIAVLILVVSFFRKESIFKLMPGHVDFGCIRDIVVTGSPRISRYISKILSKILTNRIIIYFGGTMAMSAMSVKQSLIGFLYVIGLGISECVKICTQIVYSEKDEDSLKILAKNSVKLALMITVPLAVITLVLCKVIAALFVTESGEVLELTAFAVACVGVSIPFNALNSIIVDYLQGAKKIKSANVMSFIHRLLALIVLSMVLGFFMGRTGVFIAIPASEAAVTLCYAGFMLIKGRNRRNVYEKLLDIPENFNSDILGSYSLSVESMDDVVNVASRIDGFLLQYGNYSKKTINYTSLCVEEMAGNVVKHGFNLDQKAHHCDIRIIIEKNNDITMRIRDDCPLFNIYEKYRMAKNADACANIGLKLVYGIAENITYISMLKMNYVTIRIKGDFCLYRGQK